MPITPSSARDVARLIDELQSTGDLRRETALARLAVIGSRAITPLLALAGDPARPLSGRLAALQTLEAIGDARALAVAQSCAAEPDDRVAIAAIGALARLARGTGAGATRAFDQLTTIALDTGASVERRLAALGGLTGPAGASLSARDERVLAPIVAALTSDPSSRIRARVARSEAGATQSMESLVDAEGPGLPEDPSVALAVVRDEGAATRVTVLRRAIEAVRTREQESASAAREQWSGVRGLLHQHLASRDSRLAMFDLRESFAAAQTPLPPGFVAAAAAIGDASCLEPIASAWVRAGTAAELDRWWRDHLAEAFRAIVTREQITRRHPTLKRIVAKWPAAALLTAAARK